MQTARRSKFSLTCVVPVYNEEANLGRFVPALCETLTGITDRYDVVVVNDGSRDGTLSALLGMLPDHPLTVVDLSRNFGKEHALTAGLEQAGGDAVILLDGDFQHPLSMLPIFVDKWRSGYDMVYGIRSRHNENIVKRWLTSVFYRLMRFGSKIDMPPDAGDFRLLDRRVVEVIKRLPERSRYMKGLYAWVGFRSLGIPFEEEERIHGRSSFGFWRLVGLALTGLTAFTELPLRALVITGLVISSCSFIYGAQLLIDYFLHGNAVPGWPTLAAGIMFFGGIQLLAIGILGEYIARIFTEVKERPNFVIADIHRHEPDARDDAQSEGPAGV